MNHHDALVIGAGQSGLAVAHALRAHGRHPVVLEAGPEPVGSWPHYYDSLTLFSPARYSSLPGLPFPGDPDHYPHRDEVIDYLRRYATHLDTDIRTDHRVTTVTTNGTTFTATTVDGQAFTAPLVIAATGGFGHPHRPALPGLDAYTGTLLHATDYRTPNPFTGQRVIVIGAGNSAVQIAVELAHHATVTLATRKPVRYVPQCPLGHDLHFWFTLTGLDTAPIGPWLRTHPTAPVFDTGHYRTAITAGRPDRRPLFTHIEGTTVSWPDGHREPIDTIILATGYRPDLHYLTPLGALNPDGTPRQSSGLSTTHPGLGYVGLDWQRSLSSASLRGVGRDAHHVVRRLLRTAAPARPAASDPRCGCLARHARVRHGHQ